LPSFFLVPTVFGHCGNVQHPLDQDRIRGICEKPKIRCEDCGHREFLPVTELVMRNHLQGIDPQDRAGRDFTIGVYPMLPDETCWFLAADFDKTSWQQDVHAFLETCSSFNVPAAIERSQSERHRCKPRWDEWARGGPA